MKLTHVRNATSLLQYNGVTFLVDPMLSEKGTYKPFGQESGFPPAPRLDQKNPLVDLPMPVEGIVQGVDAVIVTHLHLDHWDDKAKEVLPKDMPLFVQNKQDQETIQQAGFTHVEVLTENKLFKGINLTKTKGEHGRGEMVEIAGSVCGVIFKHEQEPTLYLAGDTVWYKEVEKTIQQHRPEVIIVNAGDNQFDIGGSLVMGTEDVKEVYNHTQTAKIIAVHMEALNHYGITREVLLTFLTKENMTDRVIIPDDGDVFTF